jgi:hypothetical protein
MSPVPVACFEVRGTSQSSIPIAYFEVKNTSRQEIYALIKSLTDAFDPPLRVDINPFDGEMRFYTALQTIIDDTDIPMSIRREADNMYQSEFLRDL